MAVAAEHPIALAAGAKNSDAGRRSSMSAGAAAPWKPTSPRRKRRACAPASACCIRFTGELRRVWVANYVLMGYGEGAVMGVPAHDERDFEFALKYQLPIVQVIRSKIRRVRESRSALAGRVQPSTASLMNSGEFDGLDFQAAVDAIARGAREEGPGPASACNAACATGASRASATGAARYR